MPTPKITIFTCSYNKPQYVTDAINSVLKQTFPDFEYIILENSTDGATKDVVRSIRNSRIKVIDVEFSDEERKNMYVESSLKNTYFPRANGEYIMHLADDDILEPSCFEEHLKEFEKDKTQRANYHACRIVYLGSDKPDDIMPANRIYGREKNPRDRVDGGSVMFKKTVLAELPDKLFKLNWSDAHISDGLFLVRLSLVAPLHPIDKILHTKRITKISTHSYINEAGEWSIFNPLNTFNPRKS
ncbi:hypothetical protein A2966_03595 [Candidatus Roizmanbacteria bacterium RIFCSPLOWO2_01_FULL_41_22]|uniref:Glycosyltransferase 2-like domain-containing protein n=1 Tax=Candidatus Roizmanbacteria bacterium RIFCSPLOWO2_01_FULL_41_22 TaxID=1802067 RepID=A0A1F7JAC9_9BACT|nr:MAG: hypothetical protein A2966_03595 [Candidatus Roizmanbacteria bacterium RIFCSPLOWO2_01_FULL_41_22]